MTIMYDKMSMDSRVYTDIQGLNQLKYNSDSPEAKKEVAQQFESILMQMVMTSMRNANQAFASDTFGSNQMEMYQDLFDKQLSLMMSKSGTGFAGMIEENMAQAEAAKHQTEVDHILPLENVKKSSSDNNATPVVSLQSSAAQPNPMMINGMVMRKDDDVKADTSTANPSQAPDEKSKPFASPEQFVKKLWSAAKTAASMIGASPEFLLAQAALETNWGRNVIPHGQDASSHNLFNIKAGAGWEHKVAVADTLEQKNGVVVKERASFRSYESFKDSFFDYVNVLKTNNRYSDSLTKASNPEKFASALQSAGYATDQNYADKIMGIFTSKNFQQLVKKVKAEA